MFDGEEGALRAPSSPSNISIVLMGQLRRPINTDELPDNISQPEVCMT